MARPPREDTPSAPMAAVLASFGVVDAKERHAVVEGGWSHQVWRVDTDRGAFAVKQLRREPGEWWAEQLVTASEFELSAWRSQAIPMAEPLELVNGSGVLAELPDHSRDHVYRCHRWVDGVAVLSLAPTSERSRRVGSMVASIAMLRFPCPGTTGDELPWNAIDAFDETVAEAHQRAKPWAGQLDSLADRVERLKLEFRELARRCEELCFVHRDFDPKNASVTRDGGIVLFDWDYAGPRLLSSELLDVALSFAGGPKTLDRVCAAATIDAFRESGAPPVDGSSAAAPLVEEGFRWLMVNAWRALGHRNVTDEQAAFADALVPKLAREWPSSADVIYELALDLL